MKPLLIVPAIVFGFLLTLLSLPVLMVGLGYAMLGDDRKCDEWMERAPLILWWDWLEARQ